MKIRKPLTVDDPRHGTRGGYMAHRKQDIPVCQACKDAEHARAKERYARRKEADVERKDPVLYGGAYKGETVGDQTWKQRDDLPCLVNPDLWFVTGARQKKPAALCQNCPVLSTCGQWALDNRIEWGVWGGLTERDRRAVLRGTSVVEWEESA